MPAILIPEPEVAYQILALNTEKAHNVKEKSLEVIRMYRGLVEDGSKATEEDFDPVRGSSFYHPRPALRRAPPLRRRCLRALLRRVDKFLKAPLAKAYAEREHRASSSGPRTTPWRTWSPRSRSAG